ncbi:MAG: hypothetical protein COA75_03590 [Cellvibrionales bacterium]|nr:MAG: hypothetical protein COA75_03590 [Cellvibrionales bacterium]
MFSLVQPKPRSVLMAILLLPITVLAQQEEPSMPSLWTLENSIQRVLDIAPEIKTAEAKVNASQGALQQAGAWPNPTFSVQRDDKLGIEDGSGGNDITQYAFSQPLPLSGRLSHQKAMARETLKGAEAERRYQRLALEQQTANRFRQLQLTTAAFDLAEQRLKLADELQAASVRREEAGELSKLERLRLGLVREEAQQILDNAEGEYNEALSQYRAYLGLSSALDVNLTPLTPLESVPPLATFEASLAEQPLFVAARHRIDAARSKVKLAQADRWPDPVLNVFQEEDFLDGRRQEFTGIGLSITVPLWDRKSGQRSQSIAEVNGAQSELYSLQRNITSRVKQSYLHLNHLVQQGAHYRTHVFEPARQVLDLTNKAYLSGEVEILSLIDANSTYFNAHTRYLELLQLAWLEMAELQLAAGQSTLNTEQVK